ncbi:hypothetical protein Ocin01_11866 [Orchesella cincta]|uniref:Nucleosome-remodeling factor subunit NURF301 n=1 Tax=Orchesella cincta TaxID=48709 RepID=A0A1D2MP88_ORCCI|nr:hypothetical protein Ocin01_11866 [Orchesella cincta]
MSENGVMDRPRRTTRSSLASSNSTTPQTPSTSTNPYKKPTYFSNSRQSSGGDTPTSRNTNGTPSSGRGRRGRGRPPGRGGTSSRGNHHQPHHHHHTKPECIAVRVDGRRNTGGSTASSGGGRRGAAHGGGRRSTYNSRHDYEYHYGSDFESDQNETDPDDEEIESEPESDGDSVSIGGGRVDDNAESDSDFSVSSSRVTSSSRLPSPPVPIWLDTEKVPEQPLELPNSSEDLLLSREHVVKAVEIYEPLRRFNQLVRLTPIRFEDFCGALATEDQSSLLAEIHIQLLKCIIREEDSNGTLFGPTEVKDSVQTVVYFIDHITWPESLRSYLESDAGWKEVYDDLVSVEYPFCGPAIRIKILGWLVDQFLTTSVVREQLLGDGTILHEDHCRSCNRLGELICCESCPAVYHLQCITPPLKDMANPPDDWKCSICSKHEIPGVNDCTSDVEKMGLLIRHERLGYDRHGRKYWFLVRRLLVESEDGSEVWYYSTRGQVEELLQRLDSDNYESVLAANIKGIEEEIYRQMDVTEEVTRLQNTQRRKTYLEIENGDKEGGEQERMTRLKSTGLYKLGQEGLYRTYINHFSTDPSALSKTKHNEERDRKRHMSHKFSLTTASECKWGVKDFNGSRSTQIAAIRAALSHMEAVLPTTLMHVNWPMLRKSWITAVHSGASAEDFSKAMIMISACIRNVVYNPVWSESTGHVRLIRMSLLERDERKKAEKREKKDRDDEEDRLKLLPQFIKYPIPMKHQVYKQKGEEYRIHGRWGWIWLSNLRRCKSQDCREKGLLAGPHKHVIQVKNEMGKVKTMLIDPGVYSKLMAKRNLTTTVKPPAAAPDGSPVKDVDSNSIASSSVSTSSESASGSNSNDRSAAETEGVTPADEKPSTDNSINSESEPVKAEGSEENKTPSTEQLSSSPSSSVMNDQGQERNESEKVEPKIEPESMEVDTEVEDHLRNGDVLEEHKKSDNKCAENEKSTEEDVKIDTDSKAEAMEVDDSQAETQTVAKSPNDGDKSPEADATGKNGNIEEKTMPVVATQEAKEENTENTQAMEVEATVTVAEPQDHQGTVTAPAPPLPNPPLTPDASKTDDSQGRKFKTDLVNVSNGLSSTHRILYPKVAKKSDLDDLLQRRLTLMSLEEKQLKSTYGEDMVAKAKTGLVAFEEEEKKRERETEEFPGEEVIDDNLTLAGAYAFKCYSSECRNEALSFMKTKGKNRDRIYEKICYSPMCRLKFCLQETTRFKQERLREVEREKYYKVYKEIEENRAFTLEGTSHKVYMKKLPECLTTPPVTATTNGTALVGTVAASSTRRKSSKLPAIKYPETSSFQYATSKDPSILVLAQYELKRLARTAGRHFTPCGFFPNQKSGSWGWSYPCGRPMFRTAWQYKTSHAHTLAAAATQLRVLYASIRWDDILAKIPNTEGKHQIQTDTEIITSEILNHRIVGRFIERVQYLRKMMVVPIDAPKTIREITPSRIGLRKRKRAESPDKTEPVVTEDWVDEEKLELWEIRYYGDRIDRKHDRKSESNTPSTRTKSGIAIKQPEKYDPSHNPAPVVSSAATAGGEKKLVVESSSVDKTIENVIRETKTEKPESSKSVSAVKTAELMRETIETEMKMQRAVHLSKRDNHAKHNNNNSPNSAKAPAASKPQTASQQLQQQKAGLPANNSRNIAQVAVSTPTSSKVGTAVIGKKFFVNKQNATGVIASSSGTPGSSTTTTGVDSQLMAAGILSRKPAQSTVTISKSIGGTISVVKNSPVQSNVPLAVGGTSTASTPVTSTSNAGVQQTSSQLPAFGQPQKLSVIRLPDGRLQVRGLLPGQHCYQTADGKIHVTVAASQLQPVQSPKVQVTTPAAAVPAVQQQPSVIMQGASSSGMTPSTPSQQQVSCSMTTTPNIAVSSAAGQVQASSIQVQQPISVAQQVAPQVVSSQPLINISNPVMKTAISTTTPVVTAAATSKPVQQPQQIIVQQQGGQQLIIHGTSAQALLQQQQQQQKIQRIVQASTTPTQVIKQIGAAATTVNAGKVVVSATTSQVTPTTATGSSTNSGQLTVPGRIVFQDGKALIISSPGGGGQQLSEQMLQQQQQTSNKRKVNPKAQGQGTIVRPQQVIQTNAQGQLVQGQPLQIIQGVGGQQLHYFTQGGQTQQIVIQQQQQKVSEQSKMQMESVSTATSSPLSSIIVSPSTATSSVTQSVVPSMASKVSIATTTAQQTAVKHILADGRTVLLSPQQLSDLTSGSGGRKVILNKQLVVPTSTGIRTQPQIIHTTGGGVGLTTGQPTIQILQGPGGQQFLIQQPSQTLLQQAQQQTHQQQQQVQIIVPSGQQLGGQQFLVKKFLKTNTTTSTTASITSSALSKAVSTAGNSGVVQIATTAQNQLTQLLGTNKALVRLENNQLATIQLPITATSTTAGNSTMSPLMMSKSPTVSTASPTTVSNQPQPTTTITRTPGLPISIVSPSKSKVAQQQQQNHQKSGTVQVISTVPNSSSLGPSPFSNSIISTSSGSTSHTVPTSSVVQMPGTPNKSHTIVRVASPGGLVKSVAGLSNVTTTSAPVVQTSPRPTMYQRQPQTAISVSPQKHQVTMPSPVKQPVQLPKASPIPAPPVSPQKISQLQKSVPSTQAVVNTVPQTSLPGFNSTAQVVATKSQPVVAVMPSSSPIKVVPPERIGAPSQTSNPTVTSTSGFSSSIISNSRVSTATTPPVSTIISTTNSTPTISTPTPPTKLASKSAPSKIVAQIFQTPQGPKVVIQGVSPGDLTPAQMMQLQAQIQKQLAAQQPAPKVPAAAAATKPETPKPNTTSSHLPSQANSKNTGASPASLPVPTLSLEASQHTQNSISTPVPTTPNPSSSTTMPGNGVQLASPQVLRSVASGIQSPLQSPPHNVISPASLPSLSSPTHSSTQPAANKSVVGKLDLVAAVSSVTEPAFPTNQSLSPARSPPLPFNSAASTVQQHPNKGKSNQMSLIGGPPQVLAKKSAPRKSPLRTTIDPSLDSFAVNDSIAVESTNNSNSVGFLPLNTEQQQLLAETTNALKEDIMEKKKAAATQMKLEAQREIQERIAADEASRLDEQKHSSIQTTHHSSPLDAAHARGAKKRKSKELENMESNSRNSDSNSMPSSRREPKGSKRKRKLFCVCKTPYDKDKFYVGCDKCENWFHGDCIGITEEMSKDLPEYICDDCRDDKLYCFCRKPYNESQFYIQCDKCEEWFHGRCVGVAQGESDMIGDYSCPTCEPNSEINFPNSKKLDSTDYASIVRLLREMFQNRSSLPFRKPVTKAQAPNYFAIIKEPMDLQTISGRVEDRQYEKLRDFIGDVTKIFENCRYFNDSTSDIYRQADNLERFFVQKIWTLRQGFFTRLHQVIP